MSRQDTPSLTGQFLIAMPALASTFFTRGVIFLCQHDQAGAIGLLVNQQTGLCLGDLMAQMKMPCQNPILTARPILIGGPVERERGFVLHREQGHWNASYHINDAWSVTSSRDILEALAAGQGPDEALIMLGYAGWSAGQLEQEVGNNTWLTVKADEQIVFNTPLEERWKAAIGLVGIDPLQISDHAGHA